ncbi:MAG: VTT domain-containing protein [Gemmatimonadaceae bacterium]
MTTTNHPDVPTRDRPITEPEQFAALAPSRGWRRVLDAYAALYRWAESGWSRSAVAIWGVMQGAIVPGPSDALFIPLALADPRRAYGLAFFATIGSVLGAHLAYLIGVHAFDSVGGSLLGWLGVGASDLDRSRTLFTRYGWLIIAATSVAPFSTKMVCIAAGAVSMPMAEFTVGITVGRTLRFFGLATILRFAGNRLQATIAAWLTRASQPKGRGGAAGDG